MLRDHGQAEKYYHDMEGYNGRLDAIQAGILATKLRHLPEWNAQRSERAAEYNRLLADSGFVTCPYEPSWSKAVYHLYVVRTRDRDAMMKHLKAKGIGAGIHYPIPLHMQKAYSWLHYRPMDLPAARRLATEIVSLPMFPQLTVEQQVQVVREIKEFTGMSEKRHSVQGEPVVDLAATAV